MEQARQNMRRASMLNVNSLHVKTAKQTVSSDTQNSKQSKHPGKDGLSVAKICVCRELSLSGCRRGKKNGEKR